MKSRMNAVIKRREFLLAGAAVLAGANTLPITKAMAADSDLKTGPKPKIGIIGAGNIGGAVGKLLAEAGYPIMLSARNVDPVKTLAAEIGHGALAGTSEEAASFGEVIVMAVPW